MCPLIEHRVMVTIIALPNEILYAIFNQLSPSTLADIACVSHRLRHEAERLLYSAVCLSDTLSESSPLPWRTLRWCRSMQGRLYFIDSTKKLQIRWHAQPNATLSEPLHPACDEVASVLQLLIHLDSLDIFLGPANLCPMTGSSDSQGAVTASTRDHDNIHAIERVIAYTRLPLLRYCSLGAEWTKGVQPYTGSILTSFLSSASSLRHLKLTDHRDVRLDDLPANALPYLSSFRGSADTAAFLLPGRPIQALSLVGQDSDVNRDNLLRMTMTSVPLRFLDLSAMTIRPTLLRNVSTHFPTIEKLRVKLALRHTLHYAFTGIRLLAGLSSVLSAFHHLTFIDLSPTAVQGIGRANAQEEIALLAEWSRACPSLRTVIFPSESEWFLQEDGIWISIES